MTTEQTLVAAALAAPWTTIALMLRFGIAAPAFGTHPPERRAVYGIALALSLAAVVGAVKV